MQPIVRTFACKEDAGEALAGALVSILDKEAGGVLALPGGRSPVPLFRSLFAQPAPWSDTILTLTDDRWVTMDSEDSNEGLLRRHLHGPAAAASVVGLVGSQVDATAGAPVTAQRLAQLPAVFSAVVAGLGDDGHTASLFPGQPWDVIDGAACVPGRAPVPPYDRISLTMTRLLSTRRLFLLFGGAHRMSLATRMADGLPIGALLSRSPVPVEIFHYPD